MATFHLTANIEGMLRNYSAKKLDNLFDMHGGEAKKELQRLKSLGHKLIPSENCKHFHPVLGCRCRYHERGEKDLEAEALPIQNVTDCASDKNEQEHSKQQNIDFA